MQAFQPEKMFAAAARASSTGHRAQCCDLPASRLGASGDISAGAPHGERSGRERASLAPCRTCLPAMRGSRPSSCSWPAWQAFGPAVAADFPPPSHWWAGVADLAPAGRSPRSPRRSRPSPMGCGRRPARRAAVAHLAVVAARSPRARASPIGFCRAPPPPVIVPVAILLARLMARTSSSPGGDLGRLFGLSCSTPHRRPADLICCCSTSGACSPRPRPGRCADRRAGHRPRFPAPGAGRGPARRHHHAAGGNAHALARRSAA